MKREGNPEKNEPNSVFWHHSKDNHNRAMTTDDWSFKVVSSHNTPLDRQVTEAVKIARRGTANLLNSKNEFGCNNLPELRIQYGNQRGATGPLDAGPATKRKPRTKDPSESRGKRRKLSHEPSEDSQQQPEDEATTSLPIQARSLPSQSTMTLQSHGLGEEGRELEVTGTHSEDTGEVVGARDPEEPADDHQQHQEPEDEATACLPTQARSLSNQPTLVFQSQEEEERELEVTGTHSEDTGEEEEARSPEELVQTTTTTLAATTMFKRKIRGRK